MSKICNPYTLDEIKGLLNEETFETSSYNLVTHMMGATHTFDSILDLLLKLKQGLWEVK